MNTKYKPKIIEIWDVKVQKLFFFFRWFHMEWPIWYRRQECEWVINTLSGMICDEIHSIFEDIWAFTSGAMQNKIFYCSQERHGTWKKSQGTTTFRGHIWVRLKIVLCNTRMISHDLNVSKWLQTWPIGMCCRRKESIPSILESISIVPSRLSTTCQFCASVLPSQCIAA